MPFWEKSGRFGGKCEVLLVETSSLRLFGKEKKEERRIGGKSALWMVIYQRDRDGLENERQLEDASRRAATNDHHLSGIRINPDAENHKKVPLSSEIDLFKIQPLISIRCHVL